MLKFINLKKLTALTFIAILTAGLIAQPTTASNANNNHQSCNNNNGHGNNADIPLTLSTGKSITVTRFDPSNPGNGNYIDRRINAADSNLTNTEFNDAKAQLQQLINDVELNGNSSNGSNCGESSNAAGIVVSIEEPGTQTSQLPNPSEYYVVDFDDVNTGTNGFSKTNNSTTYSYSSDLEVQHANQWGGSDGTKFITQENVSSIRSYKIDIDEDQKYFGFWWSAGDPYNKITFKKDGDQVAEFKTEDLVDFIQSSGVSNTADYYGNPAYTGSSTGHTNEPFAFVNVFFKEGAYDEVVVATLTEGGAAFESDNHTFSAEDQDIIGEVLPGATTPAGVNDNIVTDEDTSSTTNILSNDINPNNDLSITKITINGTDYDIGEEITLSSGALLTVGSDGQTTFDPNGKFENFTAGNSVADQFTYTVQDNEGNIDTAEVNLTIEGVADAPVAADDIHTNKNKRIDEDSIKWISVLKNDNDPDTAKEKLTITAINGQSVSQVGDKVTLPSGATVELKLVNTSNQNERGKHSLKYDPSNSFEIQQLNDGEHKDEAFTYTVTDDSGQTSQGNVTLRVTGITDTFAD